MIGLLWGYLKLIFDFLQKIHITEGEFLKTADSLDLVFFKGKSVSSSVARTLCGSDYEHVALVLRGSDDRIFFFEAGSKHGVTLYSWEKFREHNWKDYF